MNLRTTPLAFFLVLSALPCAAQALLDPTPYLSSADSPFELSSPAFALEDFEGHLFNVPGASASSGIVTVDLNAFRAGLLGGNLAPFLSIAGTLVNSYGVAHHPQFSPSIVPQQPRCMSQPQRVHTQSVGARAKQPRISKRALKCGYFSSARS